MANLANIADVPVKQSVRLWMCSSHTLGDVNAEYFAIVPKQIVLWQITMNQITLEKRKIE